MLSQGRGSDELDPEGSDSDVSVTTGYGYRQPSPPAVPTRIPLAPARLDSSDALDGRIRELQMIEDRNASKQKRLRDKRRRMDDKIIQKREAQDRRIKAIYEARQRRDSRIAARRAREDAEFRRIDEQQEEEETSLRHRLKRLKRGLPLDESSLAANRRIETASTSPPGPAYSSLPPPAKRHQSNPPGQNASPLPRPAETSTTTGPAQTPPQAPSYSFYQGSAPKPYSMPFHNNATYSTVPPPPMVSQGRPPSGLPSQVTNEPSSLGNGRPGSPLSRPPQTMAPTVSNLSTAPPPRQPASTYDTRPPPPPPSSGFASVNAPPQNPGFATVNSRFVSTPPASHSPLVRHESDAKSSGLLLDASANTVKSSSASSTPVGTGKRTPSTTHPYQMSEAFANRHHHCERVDDQNRGIWTSHGPGGTQEHPTGPPVEMYLRCNHDNCRRIDWRTVHGLQCHIVKSHEQPKGTIGSLEKALDRYGVPVREIEEYEKEHGVGSGGTVADPKNLKIKNKTREAGYGRRSTPGSYGIDPLARPAGYKPSPTASPTTVHSIPRFNGVPSGPPPSGYLSHPSPSDARNSSWSSVTQSAYGPLKTAVDSGKQLQGDAVMKDAPNNTTKPPMTGFGGPDRRYDYAPRPYDFPPRPLATNPPPPSTTAADSPRAPAWSSFGRDGPGQARTPTYGFPSFGGDPRTSWGTPVTNPHGPIKLADRQEKLDEPVKSAPTAPAPHIAPQAVDTMKRDGPASQPVPEKPDVQQVELAVGASTPADQSSTSNPGKPSEIREDGQAASVGADAMDIDSQERKDESRAPMSEMAKQPTASAAETQQTDKDETEVREPIASSGGPASGTRSAQSPLISNKGLPPSTGSAKRMSRRSSMARKLSGDSGDGRNQNEDKTVSASDAADAEADKKAEGAKGPNGSLKSEPADDDGEGDTIHVTAKKGEREELKDDVHVNSRTPPRRAASGRFTRKRTLH
jgi:hypothetical protein